MSPYHAGCGLLWCHYPGKALQRRFLQCSYCFYLMAFLDGSMDRLEEKEQLHWPWFSPASTFCSAAQWDRLCVSGPNFAHWNTLFAKIFYENWRQYNFNTEALSWVISYVAWHEKPLVIKITQQVIDHTTRPGWVSQVVKVKLHKRPWNYKLHRSNCPWGRASGTFCAVQAGRPTAAR